MFDFVLKTRDENGKHIIRRFDTASEFLGLSSDLTTCLMK